jgi:threonine aldolase
VLAAAALYALDHHVQRLAEDHENAALFAEGLQDLPGLVVGPARTNMVYADTVAGRTPPDFAERLARGGVLCSGGARMRFVFHLGVSRTDTLEAVRIVRAALDS